MKFCDFIDALNDLLEAQHKFDTNEWAGTDEWNKVLDCKTKVIRLFNQIYTENEQHREKCAGPSILS